MVEKLITESSDREALQSELQALKNSVDKTLQEFVNWFNLAKEPEEIDEITNEQYEVQNSRERISADASYRLERLELKEEIRSNSSHGSRKSKFSRLSSKSSSSSKSALLGIKVPVTQAPVSVKQLCYEAQASTPISAFSSSVSQLSVPLTSSPAPVTQSSVLESPVSVSQSAAAGLQSGYVSQIPATSIQSIMQQPCVPRSLYGDSPLFVPPQPQLPQVSPAYFLPSSDNTQQINDALTKVTQLQRLPQGKPDVFKGEEKDKTRFFLRGTAFDALVDSVPVSSQQKLHLLYQHLEGRAKKVVEQLQFLIGDPERAYTEARKRLKERFGHSAILSAEFEVKLTTGPKYETVMPEACKSLVTFYRRWRLPVSTSLISRSLNFLPSCRVSLISSPDGSNNHMVIMRFHPFRNLWRKSPSTPSE